MDTKDYLSHIVPTIKDLLLSQGYKQECEILHIGNMNLVEEYDNFGNEMYTVIIDVQTDRYITLKKSKSIFEVEKNILSAFNEAVKGGQMLYNVTIRPNSNVQATLFESGSYQGWRNGYFRMFISHITSKKKQAASLKTALEEYGITSFVAPNKVSNGQRNNSTITARITPMITSDDSPVPAIELAFFSFPAPISRL